MQSSSSSEGDNVERLKVSSIIATEHYNTILSPNVLQSPRKYVENNMTLGDKDGDGMASTLELVTLSINAGPHCSEKLRNQDRHSVEFSLNYRSDRSQCKFSIET